MVTGRLKSSSSKYVFTLNVKMISLESSLRCFGFFLCVVVLTASVTSRLINRQMTVVLQRDLQSRYSATQNRKNLKAFVS